MQYSLSKYESYCYAEREHFEEMFKLTHKMHGQLLLDVTLPPLTSHKIQLHIPIHKIITNSMVILTTTKWNGKK